MQPTFLGLNGEVMAKNKKTETQEPVISSIPVPPSDSALVIDLPDGQKLLVGKIEAGTVIEVATWRGTGRPDSRTNRLMLGMSNENDVKKSEEPVEQKKPALRDLKLPDQVKYILTSSLQIAFKVTRNFLANLQKVDFKNIKLNKFNFAKPNLRMKKRQSKQEGPSLPDQHDEFDVDFQRILDEVSRRREDKPKKSPAVAAKKQTRGSRSAKKSKSGSKKYEKRPR